MKIELIKEVKPNGDVIFSVEVDGRYVTGSCATTEIIGVDIFENVIKNKGEFKNKTILLTHTIIEDEQTENKAD